MEETRILLPIAVSVISLLGLLIGGVVGWVKISHLTEQNRKILCGYKNKDGSPIFRTEEECTVIHQELINMTSRKMDEVKEDIEKSAIVAQGMREDLKMDIRENRKSVSAMFLEIKEFMGSTATAINNLERRRADV